MACSAVMDLGGKEVKKLSFLSSIICLANRQLYSATQNRHASTCWLPRRLQALLKNLSSSVDSRVIAIRQGSSTQVPTSQCEQSSDHSQTPQQ